MNWTLLINLGKAIDVCKWECFMQMNPATALGDGGARPWKPAWIAGITTIQKSRGRAVEWGPWRKRQRCNMDEDLLGSMSHSGWAPLTRTLTGFLFVFYSLLLLEMDALLLSFRCKKSTFVFFFLCKMTRTLALKGQFTTLI